MFKRVFLAWMAAGFVFGENAWTWRNPLPNAVSWRGLAVVEDRVFALGGGTVAVSTNGLNWAFHFENEPNWIFFTLAGQADRLLIAGAVPDGSQVKGATLLWEGGGAATKLAAAPNYFTRLAYGNGIWMGASPSSSPSRVYVSENGMDWVEGLRDAKDLLFDGKQFAVALGDHVAISTNGRSWASFAAPAEKISVHNGVYAGARSGAVGFSRDGKNWEVQGLPGLKHVVAVTHGAQGTVILSSGTPASGFYSPDGENWTGFTLPFSNRVMDMKFFRDRYVMCGDGGLLAHSTNGIVWFKQTRGATPGLAVVAQRPGQIVALGEGGGLTSTNGVDWALLPGGTGTGLQDCIYAQNKFVAVGLGGRAMYSLDGISWGGPITAVTQDLFSVTAIAPQGFAAVGRGVVVHSPDARRWEAVAYMEHVLYDIAAGGEGFVATGSPLWTPPLFSRDLRTWTVVGPMQWAWSVEFGNGRFVMAAGGRSWVSTNGLDWMAGQELDLEKITFSGGLFFGRVRAEVQGYVSADGLRWHALPKQPVGAGRYAYFNGRIFAFGGHGTVLEAEHFAALSARLDSGRVAIDALRASGKRHRVRSSVDLLEWTDWPDAAEGFRVAPGEGAARRFFRLEAME